MAASRIALIIGVAVSLGTRAAEAADGGAATDGTAATSSAEPPSLPIGAPDVSGDDNPRPASPARRAAVRSDDETPRRAVVTTSPLQPPFKPMFDLAAEIGFVQGGEELVTATNSNGDRETLGAGDGLLLAFATRITPLWLSDRIGLGIGGSAGLKYWSVGGNGGEASMFKYLLTGSGHVLISVDEKWLLFLSGGVEKDYGIDLSVNGAGSGIPFQSRTGFVADFGAQRALDDNWSYAFSVRVTILDYFVQDVSLGANSVGVTFSIRCGH